MLLRIYRVYFVYTYLRVVFAADSHISMTHMTCMQVPKLYLVVYVNSVRYPCIHLSRPNKPHPILNIPKG